jgi:hypothetical protein
VPGRRGLELEIVCFPFGGRLGPRQPLRLGPKQGPGCEEEHSPNLGWGGVVRGLCYVLIGGWGVRPTGKSFRFVSCVRAVSMSSQIGEKNGREPFPFSLSPRFLFPFPFSPLPLPPPPQPSYPASAGLIGFTWGWGVSIYR